MFDTVRRDTFFCLSFCLSAAEGLFVVHVVQRARGVGRGLLWPPSHLLHE